MLSANTMEQCNSNKVAIVVTQELTGDGYYNVHVRETHRRLKLTFKWAEVTSGWDAHRLEARIRVMAKKMADTIDTHDAKLFYGCSVVRDTSQQTFDDHGVIKRAGGVPRYLRDYGPDRVQRGMSDEDSDIYESLKDKTKAGVMPVPKAATVLDELDELMEHSRRMHEAVLEKAQTAAKRRKERAEAVQRGRDEFYAQAEDFGLF